jgi:hypothetical protein
VTALDHEDLAADEGRQILGPVDEGRQRGAGRQADADRGDPREIASLDDRVGEVRGADHDGVGRRLGTVRATGEQVAQRGDDAARHVGRGGRLHGPHDTGAVQQDSVGISAADVYSDSPSGRLRRAAAPDGRAITTRGLRRAPAPDGRAVRARAGRHANTEVNARS